MANNLIIGLWAVSMLYIVYIFIWHIVIYRRPNNKEKLKEHILDHLSFLPILFSAELLTFYVCINTKVGIDAQNLLLTSLIFYAFFNRLVGVHLKRELKDHSQND